MPYTRMPLALAIALSTGLVPAQTAAFSTGDLDRAIDSAVDAAKDVADETGLDGADDVIDSAGSAAKSYSKDNDLSGVGGLIDAAAKVAKSVDADLVQDLTVLASSIGIDLSTAVELLSTKRQVNLPSTKLVRSLMDEANDDCQKLPQSYRIVCLQKGFDQLSDALPRRGDYAQVRAALDQAALELNKIARANRDRSKPRVKLSANRGARKFTATQSSQALDQARVALKRAKEKLLRSAPAGDPRQAHYRRIAMAFDDAARLLRS